MIKDSPVETERKQLPRGTGQWSGWDSVYKRLSTACNKMGLGKARLSDLHVETMAVMGTGHEETMKSQLWKLRLYGWIDEVGKE